MDKTIKEIKGYNGYYASADGRIFSCKRPGPQTEVTAPLKELVQYKTSRGYYRCVLRKDSKNKYHNVHRLVLLAFDPNNVLDHACHKDGNKLNNNISNLYWGTRKQNESDKHKHGTALYGEKANGAKHKTAQVIAIKKDLGIMKNLAEIARKHKVPYHLVFDIRRGRTWKYVTTN